MRRSASALLCAALLAVVSPARADIPPPGPGGRVDPGWWLPAGMNIGGTAGLGDRAGGFLLGAEVSAVYLFGTVWSGVWADALYAFGIERSRVSVGAELGWFLFGVELGYSAELGGTKPVHALRTGFVVTSGLLGAYVRWRHGLSSDGDDIEAGILVKWPFQLE